MVAAKRHPGNFRLLHRCAVCPQYRGRDGGRETALEDATAAQARAKSLRERIFLHFSQKAMVDGVLAGYRDAFADR
jgi:hypothetical protein